VGTVTGPVTRAEVVAINVISLKIVRFVSMAFAALAFLQVIMEKVIPLRKELATELSMKEKAKSMNTDQCCSGNPSPASV
jgi:hypothetical protein